MAKTFKTDSSNDLYLDTAGNLAIAKSNIDVTAELVKNYLRTFIGEIFTDTTLGLDYFGIIFNEAAGLQEKVNEIVRVCLTVELVQEVESVGYTQDKENAIISFNPTVKTVDGSVTIVNQVGV